LTIEPPQCGPSPERILTTPYEKQSSLFRKLFCQ
jgi:hypothetical protein